MTLKAEGIWACTVLSGKAGEVDGVMKVQINVQITDGPSKGTRCTYEDTITAQSAKYIAWSCKAVGWKGPDPMTLEADIAKWVKETGGHTTVEIQHIVTRKGTDKEGIWDKVKGLGRGMPAPMQKPSAQTQADAIEAMRSVMGADPVTDDEVPF